MNMKVDMDFMEIESVDVLRRSNESIEKELARKKRYRESEKGKATAKVYNKTYKQSVNGKEAQKKYRHDNSMWTTNNKYLSRKIVFIDSEGVNREDGSHDLICVSITNIKPLVNIKGLSTKEILNFIFTSMREEDLNVIYG